MAAHSSTHYIRTIHTSFTAAHNGPWARTNTVPLNVPLHYAQQPKYTHQPPPLVATPPASGAGGRRRAYAFRAPSSGSTPSSGTKSGSTYKFDPFADEPTPVPTLSTPPTPRLAAAQPPPQQHYSVQPPRRQNRGYYAGTQQPRTGFTPSRPAARGYYTPEPSAAESARYAPPTTEIWRAPSSSIPRGRSLTYEFEEYDYGTPSGGNGGLLASPIRAAPIAPPVQQRPRTPSPPAPAPAPVAVKTAAPVSSPAPNRFFNDKDAKAKLVAGILLNRVHAVGKPRRRVPSPVGGKKPYVPSSLSTVVACEA